MGIGGLMIFSSLLFITPAIFNGATFFSGILSMIWGLAMGSACIYMGKKLKPIMANLVLLFLAVQNSAQLNYARLGACAACSGIGRSRLQRCHDYATIFFPAGGYVGSLVDSAVFGHALFYSQIFIR